MRIVKVVILLLLFGYSIGGISQSISVSSFKLLDTDLTANNAAIQTYAGTALSVLAQNTNDSAAKRTLYREAIKYYDKAKELDPDRLQSNWGYNRYNAYYNLYGADDPKTKQAEADSKKY